MKGNYRKLGDIVELIDERNKDGNVQNLIGVSIDKCFIKSVANTIGTDLAKYQVIRKNDFACSLMQVSRDGKIPIACLKDYDEAIMSPAYYIFRIKNTNEVFPDYLTMWFMRTEFDREASYIAVGGVRGSMPWEDFCDMKLPVPDLKEQEKIVNTYNAITKRIQLKQKINENLEKTAQTVYKRNTNEYQGDKKQIIVENYCNIFTGKKDVNQAKNSGKYKFFSCSPNYLYSDEYIYDGKAILVAGNGSYTGRTTFVSEAFDLYQRTYAITPKNKNDKILFFICLSFMTDFQMNMKQKLHGSAIPYIVYDDLAKHCFEINPNWENDALKIEKLFSVIKKSAEEILELQNLKQLVISRISGM